MRLRLFAAGIAGIAALMLTAWSADAQTTPRKHVRVSRAPTRIVVRPLDSTRITIIGEDGVARTRYAPVRRTYLDPGTEVSYGELPCTVCSSLIPAYSVTSNIDVNSPNGSFRRMPLSDPWDLPGFPKW